MAISKVLDVGRVIRHVADDDGEPARSRPAGPGDATLALQRQAGNAAVTRLMRARSVGRNVSVQRNDDPGQGAAGPTAPVGAIVRVAGIDLPDGPGLEARLAQIAADGGRSAVHSVYQALYDEVAAIDAEHTGAEAFAEEAAKYPTDVSGVPWSPEMFAEAAERRAAAVRVRDATEVWLSALADRHESFRTLVRNAAILRLQDNRASLEAWRTFMQTEISPDALRGQVMAEQERALMNVAIHSKNQGRALDALERRAGMKSAAMRQVEAAVATGEIGGACGYCHGVSAAINFEYSHPELAGSERAPIEELLGSLEAGGGRAAPPSGALSNEAPVQGMPSWAFGHFAGRPTLAAEAEAINRVAPFVRRLGPDGYKVLPQEVLDRRLPPQELLTAIVELIEQRRVDFATFAAQVADPSFDYLILRPILRQLLPLAEADVRGCVKADIAQAESDSVIEAILVGAATVGTLLLLVFPPTTALGLASAGALSMYGLAEGWEQYEMGETLALGIGSDVLDPEQQEAAHGLMAMGLINMVLSGLDLGGLAIASVRLIRSGSEWERVLDGLDAVTDRYDVAIRDIGSNSPLATVTERSGGSVVWDGPLHLLKKVGLYEHAAATGVDVVRLQELAFSKFTATGGDAPVKVVPAHYSPLTDVSGYITQAKFVNGRTPAQLADELGVTSLRNGVHVYRLDVGAMNPSMLQLRGLSQSPAGKSPLLSTPQSLASYPVGAGSPQWEILKTTPVPATLVGTAPTGTIVRLP